MKPAGYVFSEKDLVNFVRTQECSNIDCDIVSCNDCPLRDLHFTDALLYIAEHLEQKEEK